MGHHLERGGGSPLSVFGNGLWEVLQDRSTGNVGMSCQKLGEVVAATATDVDDEYGGGICARSADQGVVGREEVCPARESHAAGGHVGVEMVEVGWVGFEPFEHWLAKGVLEWGTEGIIFFAAVHGAGVVWAVESNSLQI